ncbi:endolytic transglycosylase MltG [Microvirga sp. W0021]|uniref:Endolytic murein transglycosylase n=1 Tax=Hohaiivirga grylli TaxID=3133970 RepID=A0ABV0BHT6_9HYPH
MFFRKKKNEQVQSETPTVADVSQPRVDAKSPSEAIKPVMTPLPPPEIEVRRHGSGFVHRLSSLLTMLIVIGGLAFFGLMVAENRIDAPGPLENGKIVVIPKNTGISEIAAILAREGVISSTSLFQAAVWFGKNKGTLKAGEFQFKANTSISEAIDTLIQGKSILHTITVPEGLTSDQIVARLMENDILTGEIEELPPEGSLLPDTYKFSRSETRQQILNRMQAAQKQALAQIWSRKSADIPLRSPKELVILASIVEKETGRADERSRVAAVFINRLNKGMKLQSDPTIVYGLVGGKGTLGRGIKRSEIDRATPYNTYVIEGLPPGPIANPGRAAMEAVANPSRTKDLFFVADGTGGHTFSETYDQHTRSVQRWRQIEKAKSAKEEQEDMVDRLDPESEEQQTQPAQGTTTAPRAKGFDASEGTDKDPLKNNTYDLNSIQVVPDNMKLQ